MVVGHVRIDDIPRVIGWVLLTFPALFTSLDGDHQRTILGWIGWSIPVGCLGALGSLFCYYDYKYLERYKRAFWVSWFLTACLLQLAFRNLDAVLLVLAGKVFGCLAVGLVIFCAGRSIIDLRNRLPVEDDDIYTIPRALARMGWYMSGFGFFFIAMEMSFGIENQVKQEKSTHISNFSHNNNSNSSNNNDNNTLDWPDSYYYALMAAVTFTGALMIAYPRTDRLAYFISLPIGCTIALFLIMSDYRLELRESSTGDVGPLFFVVMVVGTIPGCGIFVAIKKYCLPSLLHPTLSMQQRWDRINTEEELPPSPASYEDLDQDDNCRDEGGASDRTISDGEDSSQDMPVANAIEMV